MAVTTTPPGHDVVLFDGHCVFCKSSVARLRRQVRSRDVEYRSYRAPGALDALPGVTFEMCDAAMQLVREDGHVFPGFEAVVQVLRRQPLGRLARAYYLPGVRQVSDAVYRRIAKNRLALAGKACDDGSCQVHLR